MRALSLGNSSCQMGVKLASAVFRSFSSMASCSSRAMRPLISSMVVAAYCISTSISPIRSSSAGPPLPVIATESTRLRF